MVKVERDRKEVDLHPKSYHVRWVPCAYHVQDCLVLKGFLYPVACTVLSDVSCPVGNVSRILLPLDHLYHVQDCLVLKAFSHRLISGTAVYESWTFVLVDHLYHEVTDRV